MKRAIKGVMHTAGGMIVLFTAFLPAFGQETDVTRRENERDLEQRVFNLGLLRKGKSTPKNADTKVVMEQVQNDFTRIQVVDNDLAEAVDRKGALDLNFAGKSVAEIEKLAERLMNNLTQTKHGKTDKRPQPETAADLDQLKQWLVELDKLIVEFTHNLVFKETSPDDAKLAAKALRDLDQIIVLSGQTRRSTEKFIKETKPSPD